MKINKALDQSKAEIKMEKPIFYSGFFEPVQLLLLINLTSCTCSKRAKNQKLIQFFKSDGN